jgi:peptide/nickel transport system substrate-binding protein
MTKHSDETSRSAFPMPALHRREVLALGTGALFAASGFSARAQTKAAPPPPAKPTGQVVVGLSQEPTAFNPLMPGIEVDETVWMQVFNTMWLADPQGNLMPDLAAECPARRMAASRKAAWPGRSSCARA